MPKSTPGQVIKKPCHSFARIAILALSLGVGGCETAGWGCTARHFRLLSQLVVLCQLLPILSVQAAQDEINKENKILEKESDPLNEAFSAELELLGDEIAQDEVRSASKHRQSILLSPAAISVYSGTQIRASGARNLAEFLRRVPGIDVFEVDPLWPVVGSRAMISRSNHRVLLLHDGREHGVELLGYPLWSTPTFDLEEIERVEVIRGPGSALYGANAFSALVNVTTLADFKNGIDLAAKGGEQGFFQLVGRIRGERDFLDGTLSHSFSIHTERISNPSDPNFLQHNDFRSHAIARYRKGDSVDFSMHAGLVTARFLMYSALGEVNLDDASTAFVMTKAAIKVSPKLKATAQIYLHRNEAQVQLRARVRALDTWLADIPGFHTISNTLDGQLQVDWLPTQDFMLIAGGNLRYTSLSAIQLIPERDDETRAAGFAHAEWRLNPTWQLSAGMRLDGNSKSESALSPRVALIFRPSKNQSFRLGYSLAYRKPVFLENSMHFAFESQHISPQLSQLVDEQLLLDKLRNSLGNPSLVNEKIQSLEAGWRAHLLDDQLQLSLDTFYNRYLDTIYLDIITDLDQLYDLENLPEFFSFQNSDQVFMALGSEAHISYQTPLFNVWANLGIRFLLDEQTRERILDEPVIRVNVGGGLNPQWGPHLDLALHYVSQYTSRSANPENLAKVYLLSLGNAFMLIGRIGYRLRMKNGELDIGLTARLPLFTPFREVNGVPVDPSILDPNDLSATDYGGEKLPHLLAFYLRVNL